MREASPTWTVPGDEVVEEDGQVWSATGLLPYQAGQQLL